MDILIKATEAEGIRVEELRADFNGAVRTYQTAVAETQGISKPRTDVITGR